MASVLRGAGANLERLAPAVVNTAHAIAEQLMGDVPDKPRPRHEPAPPAHGWSSEAHGRLVAMGERGEWF